MPEVFVVNNNKTIEVPKNTDIIAVCESADYKPQYPVLGALINNKL